MVGNFDNFQSLIASLNKPFAAIGVSETWLNDQTIDLIKISGYDFISNHCTSKTGGGVGIYLQDCLQYKLIQNCTISNPEAIESLFIEILHPHGKNIIVGTIYRPPYQNFSVFIEELNNILSIISKDNKNCYLMGDFNLDLLNYEHHTKTQDFLEHRMVIPLITRPTRVTAYSAMLIDNIFTNCFSHNILSGNILNDFTDHFPIFAFFNNEYFLKKQFKLSTRDFREENVLIFQSCVSQVDWSSVVIGQDPNSAFDAFLLEYNRHYENCFPIITTKINRPNKPRTPWISKGILISVNKKNRLYREFIKHRTSTKEA